MDFRRYALHVRECIEYILYVIGLISAPMSDVLFNFRQYEDLSSLKGTYEVNHFNVTCEMYWVRNGENWQYHAICENKITGERISVLSPNEADALTSGIKQLSQYHTRGDSGIFNKDYESKILNTSSSNYDQLYMIPFQDTQEKKCLVETSFHDVFTRNGLQFKCICIDSCTKETETAIMFRKWTAEKWCKKQLERKIYRLTH